ncbi:MAG: iron-siderophore ABC transporter substrate-binding protein [Tildeniella torsiva UHER 1998/13D]|jgi:iron complex transport system substrate-binding protein|nr:iron-siderophore ABC transporter substrate-binding protein [Tildeniella torsiva UHER 1998/13D]
MKRFLRHLTNWACLGIVAFVLVTACHQSSNQDATVPSAEAENCRVVQHPMGETCIPLNPQRIVTLDILNLSNLIALGIKPMAAEIWSPVEGEIGFPEHLVDALEGIDLYDNSMGQSDLEKVLQLKPDLIVGTSDPSAQVVYQQLSKIAPTVFIPWPEISRNWKQNLIETGKIFNKVNLANQFVSEYYQRIEGLKKRLNQSGKSSSGNQGQPFYASFAYVREGLILAQRGSFSGTILTDLELLSPQASDLMSLPISEESLPDIDSNALFVGAYQEDDRSTLESLRRSPLWPKVKAVQQKQVYFVDFYSWYGFDFLSAHAVLDDIEKYLLNTP